MPQKILIVGASGQLGAALCRQLGSHALPAARRQLHPDWIQIDLEHLASDPSAAEHLIARHRPDAVVCAAGATDVERCEFDHLWASGANHLGPLALARAAKSIPYVFLSTDYVFDGSVENPGPYSESAPTHPLSVYGRTKLEGENSIQNEHTDALVLRTTTVYGPDPQKKNFLYTLKRLLTEGKTMRVPKDQLATPTHVEDLAAATLKHLEGGHRGVYHVAGPEFLSRSAFAYRACDILGLDAGLIQPVTTAELNQKAARPLLGGLSTERSAPGVNAPFMRSPDQGIRDWAASA